MIPLVGRAADAVLFRRGGIALTSCEFLRDADRVADGLPAGRHVINLCQDRYAFAVTLAAALLREKICLLSSDRSDTQLRRLADRFDGAASVSDDADCAGAPRHHRIRIESDPAPTDAAIPLVPAERLAAIVFTSGSTGTPVAHEKNFGALASRSRAAGRRFAVHAHAVSVVGTVPPQHMYGFETTILLPLHASASSWCGPAFYPADIRDALAAVPAPRLLVTTPLQLRALVQAAIALPELTAIISATAPLDPALAAAAERLWGAPVQEIFGATEVGSIASRRTTEGDMWTLYDGVGLSANAIASAPGLPPCTLGDSIELCGTAQFRLLGRADDMVKLGGRRASLAGLNRILTAIAGVQDGVMVVPDDLDTRPSARLLAFVIAPGRAAADILAELRQQVDPVFLPRRIVLVDRLPRNELGKLPRAAMAPLLAQAAE